MSACVEGIKANTIALCHGNGGIAQSGDWAIWVIHRSLIRQLQSDRLRVKVVANLFQMLISYNQSNRGRTHGSHNFQVTLK